MNFIKGSINRLFKATRGEALACFFRSEVVSYNNSPDSAKLRSAVQKYIIDYGLSAESISNKETNDSCLNQALQWLSLNVKPDSSYQLFLLYDNLITLRWLYSLSLEQTLSNIKNVEISQLVRCLRGELKEKGKGIVNKELLQLHNKLVCL